MHLHTDCVVSGQLSVILYLARVMGIAPLKFDKVREGWRIRVTKVYRLYGQILITTFVVISVVALMGNLLETKKKSITSTTNANRIVWVADMFVTCMVNLALAYSGDKRMSCVVHSVAELKLINQKLHRFSESSRRSDWKNKLLFIFALLLSFATLIIDYIVFLHEEMNLGGTVVAFIVYIFHTLCCVNLAFYTIQFNQMVLYVLPSLRRLNKHLLKLVEKVANDSLESSLQKSYTNAMKIRKVSPKNAIEPIITRTVPAKTEQIGEEAEAAEIHKLGQIYWSLADITRELNETNAVPLALMLMSILMHLVVTMYHIISGIFTILVLAEVDNSVHNYIRMLSYTLWAIFHFVDLLMIVEPCHQTSEEMDMTKDLVTQLKRYTPLENIDTNYELKLFYHHLMLKQVNYSPLDLFIVDRSLIVAIMDGVTTYLVILVQL